MQGDHKEQNGSHSLNRWKERLALQHRHAEVSTGSKPCILRGILSKGPQALMTRFGPSHRERTRDTAHKIVSEFFSSINDTTMYSIERWTDLSTRQWPNVTSNITMYSIEFSVRICYNVFNREEDKAMVRTVTLMFHTVFL